MRDRHHDRGDVRGVLALALALGCVPTVIVQSPSGNDAGLAPPVDAPAAAITDSAAPTPDLPAATPDRVEVIPPETGGEGPNEGGAQEESGGSSAVSCAAPTSSAVLNGVPWLAQSPPGTWEDSRNCGQTSLAMVRGYLADTMPSPVDIETIQRWIQQTYRLDQRGGSGSYTTTAILERAARELFGLESEAFRGESLEFLHQQLREGVPVIVNIPNQYWTCQSEADCAPCPGVWAARAPGTNPICRNPNPFAASCTDARCVSPRTPPRCERGVCTSRMRARANDHFGVVVGIDDRYVYVSDPGRSTANRTHVQYRPYERGSFCEAWNGVGVTVRRCVAGARRSCDLGGSATGQQTCGSDRRYGTCAATNPCEGRSCNDRGRCMLPAGRCTCDAGYDGENCERCASGFSGFPSCRQDVVDPCAGNDCNRRGTCVSTTGLCRCNTGHEGDRCERCAAGYQGWPDCRMMAVDPCATNDCSSRGTCSGGRCTCTNGHDGARCERCAAGFEGWPDCRIAPTETCNGRDDDGNGVVDDPFSCWRTLYRFVQDSTGARCLGVDGSAPARCAGYRYEREAFIVATTAGANTYRAVQCSRAPDHIVVDADSGDRTALQGAGYDCSLELGHIYRGDPGRTPFTGVCPVWRYRYNAGGGGAHIFTVGADSTSGLTCEAPSRGWAAANGSCFGTRAPGCS